MTASACCLRVVVQSLVRTGAKMKKLLKDFFADETGATAIEYGLIATGIAIAIITAAKGVGTKLSTTFNTISTSLK
jgi:pilus assembly protein Flp/PilA